MSVISDSEKKYGVVLPQLSVLKNHILAEKKKTRLMDTSPCLPPLSSMSFLVWIPLPCTPKITTLSLSSLSRPHLTERRRRHMKIDPHLKDILPYQSNEIHGQYQDSRATGAEEGYLHTIDRNHKRRELIYTEERGSDDDNDPVMKQEMQRTSEDGRFPSRSSSTLWSILLSESDLIIFTKGSFTQSPSSLMTLCISTSVTSAVRRHLLSSTSAVWYLIHWMLFWIRELQDWNVSWMNPSRAFHRHSQYLVLASQHPLTFIIFSFSKSVLLRLRDLLYYVLLHRLTISWQDVFTTPVHDIPTITQLQSDLRLDNPWRTYWISNKSFPIIRPSLLISFKFISVSFEPSQKSRSSTGG